MLGRRTKLLLWAAAGLVAMLGAARVAWLMFETRQNEERRQVYVESFAVESNVALAQLERFVGFSRFTSRSYPQVSQEAPSSALHWRAAAHHGGHQGVMTAGARGLVVETSDDGQNHMARIQFDLPDALRAERWEDVVWIAFVYRSMLEGEYEYQSEYVSERDHEAAPITVERVDVRLVTWEEGRLAARGTVGAVPGGNIERHRPQLFEVRDTMLLALVTEVFQSAVEAPEQESGSSYAWNGECIADRLSPDSVAMAETERGAHPSCLHGATPECMSDCHAGVGASCAEAAYVLEHGEDPRSQSLYEEGCMYGYLNACTNHGAFLTLRSEDVVAQSCARRVFEHTCQGGDHFGCGMLGQMQATGAGFDEADPAAAHALLERSCRELGAFSCSVLGRLGAAGMLGDDAVSGADAALERACQTGYPDACPIAEPGGAPAE